MLIVFAGAVWLSGQVEFRKIHSEEDMQQVWEDAKAQHVSVFVDIYATWCGPCKWMDANVFALENAGAYMNEAFINVKMDGESEFGRLFAMKSGLSAYPSFFLYNSSQDLMNTIVGAVPWEELQPQLETTLEFYPVLEVLQNKFESGILKRAEYPRFTGALRKMGKNEYGKAVAESYIAKFGMGSEMTEDDIRVLAFYTDQESAHWEDLVSNIPELRMALGGEYESFIDHIVTRSIELAVEGEDITYISDLNKILPALTEGTSFDPVEMNTRTHVYYYHYTGQFDELINYINTTYESEHKGDSEWLFSAASDAVFLDPKNEQIAEQGLDWFRTCIDLKETHAYYYHLALCQYLTGDAAGSVETLNKSLEFTDDPEAIETTKSIIEQVRGEL